MQLREIGCKREHEGGCSGVIDLWVKCRHLEYWRHLKLGLHYVNARTITHNCQGARETFGISERLKTGSCLRSSLLQIAAGTAGPSLVALESHPSHGWITQAGELVGLFPSGEVKVTEGVYETRGRKTAKDRAGIVCASAVEPGGLAKHTDMSRWSDYREQEMHEHGSFQAPGMKSNFFFPVRSCFGR